MNICSTPQHCACCGSPSYGELLCPACEAGARLHEREVALRKAQESELIEEPAMPAGGR